jgi:hypothetical protein
LSRRTSWRRIKIRTFGETVRTDRHGVSDYRGAVTPGLLRRARRTWRRGPEQDFEPLCRPLQLRCLESALVAGPVTHVSSEEAPGVLGRKRVLSFGEKEGDAVTIDRVAVDDFQSASEMCEFEER